MVVIDNFFYLIILLFIILNFTYRKISKDIKNSLNITEYMFSGEIWEMIKEESKKGNKKARVAVMAYYLDSLCLILMVFLLFLLNI